LSKSSSGTATRKSRNKSEVILPEPLKFEKVHNGCSDSIFRFEDTAKRRHSYDIISQDRAVKAINLGLGIRQPGYNIYVAGYSGTGKTSVIRTFLEKWSKDADDPIDWVYVYDFENKESPSAISLPRGEGRQLRKFMETFVRDMKDEIPKALQSEDYENAINAYLSSSNERKSRLYNELEKLAKSLDFTVKSTRVGIETIPVVDGRSLTEKEYNKLEEKERERIEQLRTKLEPEVLDFARKVRAIDKESREFIEQLRGEVGDQIVSAMMEPLFERYGEQEQINDYLEKVKDHILENVMDFVEADDEEGTENPAVMEPEGRDRFKKYGINVFVDNTNAKGAPVIIEENPTFYNLFGKVEKSVEHGMYHTDHTMIKNGAVHRANGGYLVLQVLDIFKNPSIWETLKRILRNRKAFIEDMGEQYQVMPTSGLRPEAIPLEIKVILIGSDDIYHLLVEEDEDFRKIFKIKADFDYRMPRDSKNINSYATFVATRSVMDGLLPFDRSGVAAIIEHSSRLVEDQRKLSTQFGEIKDLSIESDYFAREARSKKIKRVHIEQALDEKYYRLNLVEDHMMEMIQDEDILIDVAQKRIGQINGLTVYEMGDIAFGKVARITCTTSMSDDGVINVERASRLSGKIHDKGIHIVSGFLGGKLARRMHAGFSASVCFEQSYGYVDGDSASAAETIAIISSLAEIPILQNFAITGSMNQLGDIQPIGGINEKIEGFYRTCAMIGRKRKGYCVVVPYQNSINLMLHRDVRTAVKNGALNIYPVRYIWEAFELLTGVPLGINNYHQIEFEPDSALDQIKCMLESLEEEEMAQKAELKKKYPEKPAKKTSKA
jgi:predicted ATP-dependent protease